MQDIVNPGGRPMTGYLQNALDGLDARARNMAIRVFGEMDPTTSVLGPLYHAIVVELQLCGLRETETDRQFRSITQGSIPDPPIDRSGDRPGVFDPVTGSIVLAGEDSAEPPSAA